MVDNKMVDQKGFDKVLDGFEDAMSRLAKECSDTAKDVRYEDGVVVMGFERSQIDKLPEELRRIEEVTELLRGNDRVGEMVVSFTTCYLKAVLLKQEDAMAMIASFLARWIYIGMLMERTVQPDDKELEQLRKMVFDGEK